MSSGTANTTSPDAIPEARERNYPQLALIIGIAGLVIAGLGLILGVGADNTRAVLSWLIGITFWLSIAVGSLMLVMLFHVFKAKWAIVVRRPLEHIIAAFPWLALLFVPLILIPVLVPAHAGVLWKWMEPGYELVSGTTVQNDALYIAKEPYLNLPFFVVRAALYFAVFCGLAYFLRKYSFTQDYDGDARWTKRSLFLSAAGIPLAGLALTFAAVDWYMTLEYHWFSTMYGVWFFAASMRAAIAVITILLVLLAFWGPLKGLLNTLHYYLLGCMALAFTVFWAYISFSQYFLIYNANIPEETFWYNLRTTGGWWWACMILIFVHFLVPFIALLWYKNKVILWRAVLISAWILVFHLIDVYFNLVPGKEPGGQLSVVGYPTRQFAGLELLWDVAAIIGVGGICAWAFLKSLGRQEPIPIRDPRIQQSLDAHE